MTQKTIEAILFDFDGTLVDSIHVLEKTYYEFLSQRQRQGSASEFNDLNGPSLKEIVAILAQRHALEGPAEELFEAYMQLLELTYLQMAKPFEHAKAVLDIAREQFEHVALVTSTSRSLIDKFVSAFGWQPYFTLIVTGDEVVRSKPYPDIYELAMTKLNLHPQQVIVIEDSRNGVKAASAAGLSVIAVNSNDAEKSALLDAGALNVFPDLSFVAGEIASLNAVT